MVLYFSGTGNSRYIAKLISDKMSDRLYSINDGIKHHTYPTIEGSTIIFAVPTYAWRIPRLVSDWIKAGEVFNGRKAYFLLTCGGGIGNAEKFAKMLCAERNMVFMGCAEILMPENYIARYDCPNEDESVQIVDAAENKVMELISLIREEKEIPSKQVSFSDKMKSGIINDVFYPFCVSAKKFYSKESCIGCGKCEMICPTNNIRIENDRPVWGKDCTHCMACICHCPTEAIEYGKISTGKRRYRCPK